MTLGWQLPLLKRSPPPRALVAGARAVLSPPSPSAANTASTSAVVSVTTFPTVSVAHRGTDSISAINYHPSSASIMNDSSLASTCTQKQPYMLHASTARGFSSVATQRKWTPKMLKRMLSSSTPGPGPNKENLPSSKESGSNNARAFLIWGSLGLVGIILSSYYLSSGKTMGDSTDDASHDITGQVFGSMQVAVLKSLPLRTLSRWIGDVAKVELPQWMRVPLIHAYASAFGCDLHELKEPDLSKYRSLGEFFYRELRDGVRVIDGADLVSPADGKVMHIGRVLDGRIEQIKGMTYSMEALLGEHDIALFSNKTNSSETTLYDCVIYLSPGDYHRFHSPAEWRVARQRHIAGEMFSVAPSILKRIKDLFVLNERVVLLGEWKHGFFAMVPVAATNVGNIKLAHDESLQTNVPLSSSSYINVHRDFNDLQYGKGDQIGGFQLGSTIVLVFQAPSDFHFNVKVGDKVKFGQVLGQG